MVQAPIPILEGIYADSQSGFVSSLPINREPFVQDTGISKGYLRCAPGVDLFATGPGADRGGINWNETCYRVMGTALVSIAADGTMTTIGDVGAGGPAKFDYSFDRLGINSGTDLWYWDGTALARVTDIDLGTVIDFIWVDGYFMTTDGEFIVVTDLNDPFSVDPLKYGSSEADPDPITGLIKIRDEVYALNRNSIQGFTNVGGSGFPFSVNPGAIIDKGCVGPRAKAIFMQSFAFVGSARNEALAVYMAGAGQAEKISGQELDDALALLTDEQARAIELETRIEKDEQRLIVHLPDQSFVFYASASQTFGKKVWTILKDGILMDQPYASRHLVRCYAKWIVGDDQGRVGVLNQGAETRFGSVAGWQFDTPLVFNGGSRGIINALELVGLPGNAPFGTDPRIFLSITTDGRTWGQERSVSPGAAGERRKRTQWRPGRRFDLWCGLRFRGADAGTAPWSMLNADIEGLGDA